ncbi:MAG: hypothetical protein ACTXOO_05215 [Sodalis sp. (in: enterobacteria)]
MKAERDYIHTLFRHESGPEKSVAFNAS